MNDPDPELMDTCSSSDLRKAARRVSLLYDEALAPCGLRSTQRSLLAQVAKLGTPRMSELAAAQVLDRSALNHNLKPLIRDGLVSIELSSEDRRSRRIKLTSLGLKKLAESDLPWSKAQRRFEAAFGSEHTDQLGELLDRILSPDFVATFRSANNI